MKYLLTLPENLVSELHSLEGKPKEEWFVTSDPEGVVLGSGGGTANLLYRCWVEQEPGGNFEAWMESEKRVLIHAGGKSRRLPAYAATGKILTPVPVYRWERGQRIDQKLLDIQLPFYQKILSRSPERLNTLIASGDILIINEEEFGELPDVDVLLFGTWTEAVQASRHGVFFCHRNNPEELSFVLQKPSISRIQELIENYYFLMDAGVWLLSSRAISKLMGSCSWNNESQTFNNAGSIPSSYDLYGEFSRFLGSEAEGFPNNEDRLTTAVVPLKAGSFYHYGTSRELIESTFLIQNKVTDQREIWHKRIKPHPDIFVMNVVHDGSLNDSHSNLWIENSYIPSGWSFSKDHIFTGIPSNKWNINVPAGICIDAVPVGDNHYCIRPYGIDDSFNGKTGDKTTTWLNAPSMKWFEERFLNTDVLKIDIDGDIFDAALFPVVTPDGASGELINWMINSGKENKGIGDRWIRSARLSASQVQSRINLKRLYSQRKELMNLVLPAMAENHNKSVFYQLDLDHLSGVYSDSDITVPDKAGEETSLMSRIHNHMFLSRLFQKKNMDWKKYEQEAFGLLRSGMISQSAFIHEKPSMNVLADQIVWARSPVRLDIAGGWTDTPPFCILNGGRVVNMAVELNGQPPIQVYITPSERMEIRLKSIDLGQELIITRYSELEDYSRVGSGFTIAKAALMLSGFHPAHGAPFSSLKDQLNNFGSGFDISFLAAIPKGSGLGTSSILAATLLGALSEYCGLKSDHITLGTKTLVLEQMLTTGGGWQDQYGGLLPGIKLIETTAGFSQAPEVRWLPEHMLRKEEYSSCMMLYYTGVTRVAKKILGEIVRKMFLNNGETLAVLKDIKYNASRIAEAIRKNSWGEFNRCVEQSWVLNQQLDKGTNPPSIQNIIDPVNDYLLSKKLLGAGGGGYILLIAKDHDAAGRVKTIFNADPPNSRGRFVDLKLSETGLSVTKS